MMSVEEFRRTQRAQGPATILAIGTAVPSNCVDQSTYPDYYFRVTKSEHMTELKEKFKRICKASMIKNRYLHLTEKILDENPNMGAYMAPSLDSRQNISIEAVPILGKEAAQKAIKEWGQPVTKITHLIFSTFSGISMPGADYKLTELLGLPLSTKRYMMYNLGCYSGGTVLRVAKDLAENNAGARVLVVSSEITVPTFHGPTDDHLDNLVAQALFSDGAAALIVGADPIAGVEKPLYQIVSVAQTVVPNTDTALFGNLGEAGLIFHLSKDVPLYASMHIEKLLKDAFDPFGVSDWNSIFWILHPGGPTILNKIENKLALQPDKLRATRYVLNEYGNMLGVCVFFILDYMRKSSTKEAGMSTTGEGCDWGVLFGIGPGVTIETVVLHSVSTD